MGKWCHLIVVQPWLPNKDIILYVCLIRIDGRLEHLMEVRICRVEMFPKEFQ